MKRTAVMKRSILIKMWCIILMIIREYELAGSCSMLKAVEVSNKSRSTVYKAIRKLSEAGIVKIKNSTEDKRSFLVIPKI